MELCTFDYKHTNLHTYSFGPAEFKSARIASKLESRFSKAKEISFYF